MNSENRTWQQYTCFQRQYIYKWYYERIEKNKIINDSMGENRWIKMDKLNKTIQDIVCEKCVHTNLKDELNTFMEMHSDSYKNGVSPYDFKRRLVGYRREH